MFCKQYLFFHELSKLMYKKNRQLFIVWKKVALNYHIQSGDTNPCLNNLHLSIY